MPGSAVRLLPESGRNHVNHVILSNSSPPIRAIRSIRGSLNFRMIISVPEFGENPAKPARIVPTSQVGEQVEAQVEVQVDMAILAAYKDRPVFSAEMAARLGHKQVSGNIRKALPRLRAGGLVEYTIPDKPRSRRQKYRLTAKGRTLLTGTDKDTEKKDRCTS